MKRYKQIDQVSDKKEIEIHFNYRPFFISLHFYMLILYHFTKDSFFVKSFYSNNHFYYYGFIIIYMSTLKYFAKSCDPPGFATDEPDVEIIENEANIDPNRYYCKHCKIYVPIRASHCSKCKKCIIRRDHHCPWTDCCIGRDNHVVFFLFTSFELFSQSIPCFEVIYNFLIYIFYSEDHHNLLLMVFIYLQVIAASTFGTVKTYEMFIECVSGIIRNLTTWERVRWSHITYLKDFPLGCSPFDKGLIGNIVEFLTMKKKKMKWEIKPPDISLFSNELQRLKENNGEISA